MRHDGWAAGCLGVLIAVAPVALRPIGFGIRPFAPFALSPTS